MSKGIYEYHFNKSVSMRDVEDSLLLSLLAAEGLHGRSQVNLDAVHYVDKKRRSCGVDATSQVGRDIARIFTGFLMNEFGEEAFQIECVYADGTDQTEHMSSVFLRGDEKHATS